MLTLYSYPEMFGVADNNGYGLKVFAFLKLAGFAFTHHPDDWKLVRFEKPIDAAPQEIPCASWRLVAEQNARQSLKVAHTVHLLELGDLIETGPAAEIAAKESVQDVFLGGRA